MADFVVKIDKLVIACDACCLVKDANVPGRGGSGKAACGIVYMAAIKDLKNVVEEESHYLGEMTVPEAEYHAIERALDHASGLCRKQIEVWSDSELAIRHLTGVYRLKAANLKPLFDKIKSLEDRYNIVEYYHHGRTNPVARRADELAGKCAKDNS